VVSMVTRSACFTYANVVCGDNRIKRVLRQTRQSYRENKRE